VNIWVGALNFKALDRVVSAKSLWIVCVALL